MSFTVREKGQIAGPKVRCSPALSAYGIASIPQSEALGLYEAYHISWLRERALKLVEDHVRAEDENTKCIGIGPVRSCAHADRIAVESI